MEGDELDKKNGNDLDRRRERALTSLVADLEQADRDQRRKPGGASSRCAVRSWAHWSAAVFRPCGIPPPASGTNTSARRAANSASVTGTVLSSNHSRSAFQTRTSQHSRAGAVRRGKPRRQQPDRQPADRQLEPAGPASAGGRSTAAGMARLRRRNSSNSGLPGLEVSIRRSGRAATGRASGIGAGGSHGRCRCAVADADPERSLRRASMPEASEPEAGSLSRFWRCAWFRACGCVARWTVSAPDR